MLIAKIFPHKTRPDMRLRVNKKLAATAAKMKGKKTTTTTLKAAVTKATRQLVAAKTGTKKRPKNKRAAGKDRGKPYSFKKLLK